MERTNGFLFAVQIIFFGHFLFIFFVNFLLFITLVVAENSVYDNVYIGM